MTEAADALGEVGDTVGQRTRSPSGEDQQPTSRRESQRTSQAPKPQHLQSSIEIRNALPASERGKRRHLVLHRVKGPSQCVRGSPEAVAACEREVDAG